MSGIVHQKRWEMAKDMAAGWDNPPLLLLYPYNSEGKKAGKVPMEKGWSNSKKTTLEDINRWQINDYESNLGLLLGSSSGIVAIDVDGKGGEEKLLQISGGDIPSTVEYLTPGGGRRLLYAILPRNKGKKHKKYYETVEGKDHEECALLGDGQQTVLPYSIHPNGKSYEFVEGKSIYDIEVTPMPTWMEKLMLENTDIQSRSEECSTKSDSSSDEVLSKDVLAVVEKLCSSCKKFKELYEEQLSNGLHEEDWFRCSRLLISAGEPDAALAFSRLSSKHAVRSEERLTIEIEDTTGQHFGMLRCTTFGCSETEIKNCFKRINMNDNNEITNSPGTFIRYRKLSLEEKVTHSKEVINDAIQRMIQGEKASFLEEDVLDCLSFLDYDSPSDYFKLEENIRNIAKLSKGDLEKQIKKFRQRQQEVKIRKHRSSLEELSQIGFIFDYSSEEFKGLNGNIFARHILDNFKFCVREGHDFYSYEEGHYRHMKPYQLRKVLRDFFHQYLEDKWTLGIHNIYLEPLCLESTDVNDMKEGRKFINVKNGLINLDTMEFERHNDSVFTTTQLPIDYKESECPQFLDFLNDIFQGDKELICLVQEIMGYCISTEVKADKMFIFLGEGSNGKSVLSKLLIALCGESNVSSVPLKELEKSFSRYDLVDKILNIATENELGGEGLNTETIKAITSGDPIRVEKKFEDGFMYRPFAKLVFAANRLPYSRDKSFGFERRLIIVPFEKTYVKQPKNTRESKKDVYLLDKLLGELDGILNFALEGFKRLRDNKFEFTEAKKSLEILDEYKLEINPYLDFVNQNICEVDMQLRLDIKHLYHRFIKWCDLNNHKNYANTTMRVFMREFRAVLKNQSINYEERKSNGAQYFYGLKTKVKDIEGI